MMKMRNIPLIAFVLTLTLAFSSGRAIGAEPFSRAAVASVDVRLFVPILVSNLPGVGGSVWNTELWVTNTSNQPVVYGMVPCTVSAGCVALATVDPQVTLIRGDVVPRPTGRWVDFNPAIQLEARIRDLSRNASSAGVELPIVREADFRSDEINLNGIPQDPRFRVTLRVYGLDAGGQVTVEQIDQLGHLIRTTAVVLAPPENPLILTGDAQRAVDNVPDVPEPMRIRIRPINGAPRIWAFASVTNNVTSEVTLIQPFRQ
jgi:hypothetical protein